MERLDSTNRRMLTEKVAGQLGLDAQEADRVVASFLDVLTEELAEGQAVNLRGFGTFEPRMMREVVRRRPDTGEPVSKPEHRRVLFRPSPALKAKVNG